MAIFYIGGHTEYRPASAQYTHYYTVGSQRVAMREHTAGAVGSVYYTLTDPLGSTSVTLSSAGTFLAEMRYKPWGESRYTHGTTPTRRQFTGQLNDVEVGLYFYNARYYDPSIGRFIQADTIVPSLNNPQTLNRFAYVNNNPLRYTDPTGHEAGAGEGEGCYTDWCWQNRWYRAHGYQWLDGWWRFTGSVYFSDVGIMREVLAEANITLEGSWYYVHGLEAAMGVWDLAYKMVGEMAAVINPYEWLGQFLGDGLTLHAVGESPWHGCAGGAACSFPTDGGHIYFPTQWKRLDYGRMTVVHEIAHAIDWNSAPYFCNEVGCRLGTMSLSLPYGGLISSYDLAENWKHEYFADAVSIWVYGSSYYNYLNDINREQVIFLQTFLSPRNVKGDFIPDA